MLSAFTARPIIELRPRDKSKIETILAHGDRILVGLNSGALRIYRLNDPVTTIENGHAAGNSISSSLPRNSGDHLQRPSSRGSSRPTDLLREVEKFSTRAIEQLAIIKEANTIVSLSNYHVSLHDLQTYELIETLDKTRNASGFAVTSNIVKDPDTGIPEIISRLAVAVKRRLLLWSWHECELGGAPDFGTPSMRLETQRSLASSPVQRKRRAWVEAESPNAQEAIQPRSKQRQERQRRLGWHQRRQATVANAKR
ncbi:hypothetical protein NLG97_g715 [Lecanicillium saksenae]|uniref:Uncharacterized protein n=1 Tax=Lecanicillium saksenae TaxID=468837 RepID=A0ACC1R726_9HYPO|nr:hypothetical protein NLG97_g715 [Lecanicillium saksenae]